MKQRIIDGISGKTLPCTMRDGVKNRDLQAAFTDEADIPSRKSIAEDYFDHGYFYTGNGYLTIENCPEYNACMSIRYPAQKFSMSRSQRKIWAKIPDRKILYYSVLPAKQLNEHIALSARYYISRSQKIIEKIRPDEVLRRLFQNATMPLTTIELRDSNNKLIGGIIYAETKTSMAGVSYYYDPDLMDISPGKQLMLTLLDEAKKKHKDHVYVGPWLEDYAPYANKTTFRPYELWHQGAWHRFETTRPTFPTTLSS